MAGTKRSWEGKAVCDQNNNTQKSATMEGAGVDEPSVSTLSIFETFRDELDQHHDRRERVIKTSRDITAMSKKMFVSFLIHYCWLVFNANMSIFLLASSRYNGQTDSFHVPRFLNERKSIN